LINETARLSFAQASPYNTAALFLDCPLAYGPRRSLSAVGWAEDFRFALDPIHPADIPHAVSRYQESGIKGLIVLAEHDQDSTVVFIEVEDPFLGHTIAN
jgi:hypothetical protein